MAPLDLPKDMVRLSQSERVFTILQHSLILLDTDGVNLGTEFGGFIFDCDL